MTSQTLVAEDKDSYIIVYDRGLSDGERPYWAYIAVRPSKYEKFITCVAERKSIHFTDYGDILRFGFDEDAPEYVKQEMAFIYGCNDDYINLVLRDIEHAQAIFRHEQEVHENTRINEIVALLKKKQPE